MLEHEIEQRCQTFVLRAFRVDVHPAIATRTVEDREVELLVGGVEVCEQVENFVDDFFVAAVRTVDLVDCDDRLQTDLQRLADDELGLRHRAFRAIDQNDRAVHHRQDALDFATEVGVAGSVDDVDANTLPFNRRRLGENRDAAFLFEVVRVHHAFCNALVFAERARLFQELVNERRFAMVNVRDDRDVAKCHIRGSLKLGRNNHGATPISLARSYPVFCKCERGAERNGLIHGSIRRRDRSFSTMQAGEAAGEW
ncbi:hypothetical protein D3C71_1068050 [compost metagenome]